MIRRAVAVVVLALAAVPSSASSDRASLARDLAPRPGPDLLYAPAPRAPQLENTGDWRAEPILVSGAESYRDGEFVYQDFLFDDHGARGSSRDPEDPRDPGDVFSAPNGTYTYPRDPALANNAADLVELRVRPVDGATAFRLTLNTLTDPERVGATIAIGSSDAPRAWPGGANVSSPAALFLTWHGRGAELLDPATGERTAVATGVDLERRQIELRVTAAAFAPGRATVRLAAGVGLWDAGRDRYLLPQTASDATTPGGAAGLERPAAFFNVAFRSGEPLPRIDPEATTNPAWWRDRAQGAALAAGDLSSLHADVDFGKLADGARDDAGVPRTGPLNRILASATETGPGADFTASCGVGPRCDGVLRTRLQPYALYVPGRPSLPGGRFGLTLLLHSLTANYNQFSSSRNQSQFAERAGARSIVITPEARGPDGFYADRAAADVFEVWADVARRYRLDPGVTSISGYSMGGFGTFKLASQYPDLFARAQPTVGALTIPSEMLASLRWIPVLQWNATADELVAPASYRRAAAALQRLRYRFELDEFAPVAVPVPIATPQHISLAAGDSFAPAAGFLDRRRVVRNPPRITFVANPAIDFPAKGTRADHAYWLSRVRTRGPGLGTVDVRSAGFGVGDPPATDLLRATGALEGGVFGRRPYAGRGRTWGPPLRRPRRNVLTVSATNVASITVDVRRARLRCGRTLEVRVRADRPLRVNLAGC